MQLSTYTAFVALTLIICKIVVPSDSGARKSSRALMIYCNKTVPKLDGKTILPVQILTFFRIIEALVLMWVVTLIPAVVNSASIANTTKKQSENYHVIAYSVLLIITIIVFVILGISYSFHSLISIYNWTDLKKLTINFRW